MALATEEGIRDRIAVLIEAITPSLLSNDKFRQWRDEGKADFATDVASSPTAALRRFQVKSITERGIPEVSNMTTAQHVARFRISISYPNNSRAGAQGARDRADLFDRDWNKINFVVGIYGRANFSAGNDCTPLGITAPEPDVGDAVTVVTFEASYNYTLDVTA